MHLHLDPETELYYEKIDGENSLPCLVFLHEGLGCGALWKGFPEQLCRMTGCPGLVYDRLGYGKSSAMKSSRTVHYLHEYALGELPEVISSVIPGKPYILIGHSDGGSISLILGAQRPALLHGIITEAAHVFVEPETLDGILEADKVFDKGGMKGLFKYHGKKTREMFKAWSETWLSEWFKYWNIEYLLPSITCPVLVIQGKDDKYGTLAQVESIESKIAGPARVFKVASCGHTPHREQPEQVLKKMAGFIRPICRG